MIAKAFLACNDVPKIDPKDHGVWRRIVCIPFTQRFVPNPSPSDPNEHLADGTLKASIEKDISFRQTFLNMLIPFLRKTVPMPEEVRMKTTRLRDSNDEFGEWLKEAIELREDELLSLQTITYCYLREHVRGTKAMAKYKLGVDEFLLKTFNIPATNYESRRFSSQDLLAFAAGRVLPFEMSSN